MLIIFWFFLFFTRFLFFLCLHSFHNLFLFYAVSKYIKQINNLHILVYSFLKRVINPCIRLSTNIYKKITVRYFHNISCCRLIAMKVYAIIQKHCNIHIRCLFSRNLFHPVVFWEYSSNNFNFSVF